VVDAFEFDGAQPAAAGLRELKLELALLARGRGDLVHALDLLELGLGLGRLGVFGAEAVDELQQAGDLALLVFVGGQLLLFVRLALLKVFVIAAPVADQPALADFDNAADDLVEELAVVRNDEDRARITLEIFLEPEQRLEVEVVGRLVQQQQIRLLRQQPRQVRPHHPAAAHLARRAVEVRLAKTQPGEDLLGPGLQAVAAQRAKAIVRVVMDFLRGQRRGRVIGFPGLEDAAQPGVFRGDGGGQFEDGFIGDRGAFLRQVAKGNAALAVELAGVGGLLPEDNREQGGLAGSVRAHQPDAVLAIDLQRGIGEQHPPAVRLGDAGQRQHDGAARREAGKRRFHQNRNRGQPAGRIISFRAVGAPVRFGEERPLFCAVRPPRPCRPPGGRGAPGELRGRRGGRGSAPRR